MFYKLLLFWAIFKLQNYFELLNVYYEVKVQYILLFLMHFQIWLLYFLFHTFLWVDEEFHAVKSRFCGYYVKKSLEPQFILFKLNYCVIILLIREIMIWCKTNRSTRRLLTKWMIMLSNESFKEKWWKFNIVSFVTSTF